jgi:hypothetical protein
MWAKIKALPLGVKIIALVVFIALGGIYKNFIDVPSSSSGSGSSGPGAADSSQVLAKLQAQWDLLQNQNVQCAAQIEQMNPWNNAAPPCEAQMQWNTAQMARLEAEIYRLKTGANVQPIDFVLMDPLSPSGGRATTSDDGPNRDNR